ncbi:MAG: Ig-like domain-containing protein [Myxococcota bacterium]
MSVALAGCGDDGGGRPAEVETSGTSSSVAGSSSSGLITTFEPTTIDPSAPSSTTDEPPLDDSGSTTTEGSGSSTAEATEGTTDGTTGDRAPSVQSTTPGDLESGVPASTSIEVEFSEPVDPATVTTNTADKGCTGSLQVSLDGFATCVPMMGAPVTSDGQTFAVTPAEPLPSVATVQIRVLASVTDAGGTPMDADFTTGTGFFVRYFHTIVIDGVNDFEAEELLPTSTLGHTGYVAYDDTYLYVGMDSPDLASDSDLVWMVAYLGGPMGTSTGLGYNTQEPILPFNARWHLRWRADDMFGDVLEWGAGAWQDAPFTVGAADVAWSDSFIELRVARVDVGDPAYFDLHLCLLREEILNEASWAAVPSTSFKDGYDPDYTQFFQFNPSGSTVPADSIPL